jgi:hypothetical protein
LHLGLHLFDILLIRKRCLVRHLCLLLLGSLVVMAIRHPVRDGGCRSRDHCRPRHRPHDPRPSSPHHDGLPPFDIR